ncbi:M12 family metallopeptidase [Idiomarina xiamenensis]|uniref:Peptidase M12A, astacin n=1 Tax=Idiomarina xiamenensis 10-D-4 TaxID=740709 RepID=K2K3F3_9GAMM|nr:M12 family metallopeptidase [Idiomarina xiamenensis]EKE82138.1 peptidase M12A, astacin [Idiomarina xiamenensis 10-D-4]
MLKQASKILLLSAIAYAPMTYAEKSAQTADALYQGQLETGEVVYKTLTGEVRDNKLIFESDIVIDEDLQASQYGIQPQGVIIDGSGYRWPSGFVPYVISGVFSSSEQNTIRQAMDVIESKANVRFINRTSQANYVSIIKGSGCYSSVGRRGGMQQLSLGNGCVYSGTAQHELLHALGFWHEQSRADRNSHVTVNYNNIEAGREHNFNQHISDGVDIGNYDYRSIMHYGNYAFSKNGQPTIQRIGSPSYTLGGNVMTSKDITTLVSMYGSPNAINPPQISGSGAYCRGYGELNWDPVSGADYYRIEGVSTSTGLLSFSNSTSNTYYSTNGSESLRYTVRACLNDGTCSERSNSILIRFYEICL